MFTKALGKPGKYFDLVIFTLNSIFRLGVFRKNNLKKKVTTLLIICQDGSAGRDSD